MKKKLGICLSGGGARGAYQIAVLKVLQEAGILDDIHAISGSSVGSLNAVLLAMKDLTIAENLWLSMDKDSLFSEEQNFIKKMFKEGKAFVFKGYYNTQRFEELIDNTVQYDAVYNNDIYVSTSHVGDENVTIAELLSLNVRNMFDKENHTRYPLLRELTQEDIKKTLLASCAIPVFFKPVVINNETYYDGGVLDNTPITPLINAGCEEIIVIDLFRLKMKKTSDDKNITIHTITPSRSLSGILNFSNKQMHRRFEIGKKDAEKFIQKYKPEDH
ncbi:MAG: patatin-like phospholipase family protein [Candidatus Izemoplasmataceae bacterium]|jgi:NTE family protein|uniref:patatin-like phospholipase family protein n=1 Tax=Liberiplasma polymorphum TaxID=3374570 RepID=UPI003774DE91